MHVFFDEDRDAAFVDSRLGRPDHFLFANHLQLALGAGTVFDIPVNQIGTFFGNLEVKVVEHELALFDQVQVILVVAADGFDILALEMRLRSQGGLPGTGISSSS